ncbi:two-component system, LuxR family, sensor kinase FixL [Burkholderiaceae bacterium]|nr:two-component system, LuxR family, sensor kinase FixL [Burkholderiaceae bacterium]
MPVKQLPLARQVLIGFGLAVVVLVGISMLSWRTTERFMRTSRDAVFHAQVVASLERALSRMYEVEAAQRGYLFTGTQPFLTQRASALDATRAELDELRRLAAGDPQLRLRLDQLAQQVDARMQRLDQVLATYAAQPAEARELLIAGFGRSEMDALGRDVIALASEQQAMLRANSDAAGEERSRVFAIFAAAVVALSGVLLLILRMILRGIDERQRAHAALAASQARLDAIVDTALDAIIVIDDQGQIERFNRAAERMFGYAANEVVGRNVSMLMPSPDRESHDGHLERYRRTGERRIVGIGREVTALRKDGSRFPADLAVGETRVGAQLLFTGLIRDISERKAAESRQAALMHDLKAANEELSNFAYVASHDLKAPLRGIGSLAHWLSTDYAERFDAEGREQMSLLLSRVKRMDRLIDGILQYSRVGRVKEGAAPVDLNALVAETVDLLAPPPNMSVTVEPLPTIEMERTRAQQLFQNLLSNAIQYMDKPRGEIRVDCRLADAGWHFRVSDNGPGIERRHWERVFQLFQSLTKRNSSESTGIGLSLVKKIVEMHGGRIWLESEPGQGCTFHFTLPRSESCT